MVSFSRAGRDSGIIEAPVSAETTSDAWASGFRDPISEPSRAALASGPHSVGVANIVQAMHEHGVHRLVCVSSTVTDPVTRSEDTGGGFVFEKVLKPFITNVIGKTMYADLLRMEELVRASDLDWTIVRPSGLFDTPTVTEYRLAEGFLPEHFTSRADLAACMLQQAASDQYRRKILAVATVEVKPKLIKLLLKEAFGISIGSPRVQPAP